jgi:hypothetical protein
MHQIISLHQANLIMMRRAQIKADRLASHPITTAKELLRGSRKSLSLFA